MQDSYIEIQGFSIQGFSRLSHRKIQGYFSDKKHKNYRMTPPPWRTR